MTPKRSLIVLAAAVLLGVAGVARAEDKKYDSKFDNTIDVNAILQNDAERETYYACFMDTGPCPNDAAKFFKENAPEAVVTSCKYCTQWQLEAFEVIVSWYVDNRPAQWNAIIEKLINDARKQGLNF